MAEVSDMGYMVDEAEGADWTDGADRTDETDVAKMALRMNALFCFDCFCHEEFKNIAHNELWEPYAETLSDGWIGRTDHTT